MRQLATIREVAEIRPIEGADRIVVARVDGWECVVQKDEFRVGDYVVYVEVDSIVPARPEFEFLRDRKFRVRTIKLRGQVSQGLVLPLSILPSGTKSNLGADVTDALGITKYDPQAQQEAMLAQPKKPRSKLVQFLMRFKWFRLLFMKPKRKGGFPDWIAKTDETRVQNLTTLYDIERKKGTEFSVTEKMDGQSATYFLHRISKRKFEFGVCSRNIRLGTPDNSSYWTVAQKYDIEKCLKQLIGDHNTVVLQGEICGTGIQGNKYHISGYELFVFYPNQKCSTLQIAELVEPLGLKTVPMLAEGVVLPGTISEVVEYSKGNSVVRKGQKREGVVMRNQQNNISFKVINPDFLLAERD